MAVLAPQVFTLLGTLVEERVGMHYAPADADLFASKVLARMAEAGFEKPLDYYYFLRYDAGAPAELDALVDALVVGETYFFRELESLLAAITHVIRPAVERGGHARIWSAACSTGEEPLSIAMLLDREGILRSCDIVATDVSARSLARAREGVYRPTSMRALARPALAPGMDPNALAAIAESSLKPSDGNYRMKRDLVDRIDYRRLNLVDDAAIAALGTFDLVLCRNVLIYFADETVRRVTASIANALGKDGRLLVGSAESLLRFGTLLRCEERGGAFFYVRAA